MDQVHLVILACPRSLLPLPHLSFLPRVRRSIAPPLPDRHPLPPQPLSLTLTTLHPYPPLQAPLVRRGQGFRSPEAYPVRFLLPLLLDLSSRSVPYQSLWCVRCFPGPGVLLPHTSLLRPRWPRAPRSPRHSPPLTSYFLRMRWRRIPSMALSLLPRTVIYWSSLGSIDPILPLPLHLLGPIRDLEAWRSWPPLSPGFPMPLSPPPLTRVV